MSKCQLHSLHCALGGSLLRSVKSCICCPKSFYPYVHVVMGTVTNPLMGSRIVHTIAVSRSNLAFGVAAEKNS